MKAVAAEQNGLVHVVDIPKPHFNEYECLVRIRACGICNSTDLKIINNELGDCPIDYPTILGHESVGEIVAVGSKVRNYKVGDRVVNPFGRLEPDVPYGYTFAQMCEWGVVHDLEVMKEDGLPMPAETEGLLIETQDDYPVNFIPDGISFEDATILLTVKENYSALKNFGLREGMDVFVFGDGPVAYGLASLLKIMGANFVGCAGHHDDRLAVLRDNAGVDLIINTHDSSVKESVGERKFDLVIDAIGSTDVIFEGSEILKQGGKIGMYGVLKKGKGNVDLLHVPNNVCIHKLNDPYGEYRSHREVCELVEAGKINLKDFYSHTMPIDKAAEAFELVKSRKAYKVVLTMFDD